MTSVLKIRGEETQRKRCTGRRPLDDGGRDWSQGKECQELSATAKLRGRNGIDSHLEALERVWSGQHLDFRLLASRIVR